MKRMSIIHRNVAAAPVDTKMITSIFGLPSSPVRRNSMFSMREPSVPYSSQIFV